MSRADQPLAYARTQGAHFVEELKEFIRFPSVSARPEHGGELRKCAAWLAAHLARVGLERATVIPTPGHPLVYAEWLQARDAPTVLIYGHYDVQPAEPLDQWRSPPFEPVELRDELHGRGASDDKGQMFAHIKAIESCLRTSGRLPVNVRCLFEGEEEIGSLNFAPFLAKNRMALAADVVVVSDSATRGKDRPAITYGMRGALNLELRVKSGKADLHDGLFGGSVHNPLQGLCDIISRLQTSNGVIKVPGFYDRVREITADERAYMARQGLTDEEIMTAAGITRSWGDPGYTLYERTTIRPALSVSGIAGGYQGPGPKSIIPAEAVAKLNFRLVAEQQPREIYQLVRDHVARLTPATLQSRTTLQLAADPVTVPRRHPFIRAAALACHKAFGATPAFVRSGGTNPAVAAFQRILGLPTALVGFGLPDDRIHAPNEKFHLPNFHKGIAFGIRFLHELGGSGSVMSHDYR